MVIKVNPIMCSDCYDCHVHLPFMCDPECGLQGMPHMAKGQSGFFVNSIWAKDHRTKFYAAERFCKSRALIIEE